MGGAATASLAEPARSGRNAVVVAAYVAILILGYILVGQAAGGYAPPRSRGGPSVMPPRETLYAVVAPDVATGRSCRFGWCAKASVAARFRDTTENGFGREGLCNRSR